MASVGHCKPPKLIRSNNIKILCVMAKIEQELGNIFKSHSDCVSPHYNGTKLINKAAMTKNMFIEVVSNLFTEREANQANSDNANCAIFDVSQQRELLLAFHKHLEIYTDDLNDGLAELDVDNFLARNCG